VIPLSAPGIVVSGTPSRPAPSFPERIGRYDLLLPIASGGMATVYLACVRGPMGFEAEVALKLTHPHLRESTEFAADLLEEAKLAVRIRHRNVAAVIDAGVDPLGVYLVMEYVEGDTLSGLNKASKPLPKKMAMRVLVDALAGLHAAHELLDEDGKLLGVVHRDFTPHNILVGTDGVARLTDFGIAKAATRLSHTRTGFVKGKIGYMSPEQARGSLVDRRCDVWAAGVIAWEVLAGKRLHAVEDDVAVLLKVATETPPRLRTVEPSIHPEIDEAVASALDRNMETRCPSALALSRRLGAACKEHGLLAETEEVAEWIRLMAGAKLAGRREDLARAKERRANEPAPPSTPEEHTPKTMAGIGAATVRELPAPRKPIEPTIVLEHDHHPLQLLKPIDEPTRTDTSSVVSHAPPRMAPSKPRILGTGAAVGALVLLALVIGRKTADAPPSPAASASAAPTATPTVATAAPAPPPTATIATPAPTSSTATGDWTPVPVPVEALPETPPVGSVAAPAPPPTRPHPGSRPHPHPVHTRPVAPSTPDGPAPLAPSPYP
jgi:eukaryotic-like serine/threonine-protein kinase